MTYEARNYAALTREELEARLARAEDVCALVGWTAAGNPDNDRQAALTQLWMRWSNGGGSDSRAANPHLDDAGIRALAEERRATRRGTLARAPQAVDRPAGEAWGDHLTTAVGAAAQIFRAASGGTPVEDAR